MLRFDYETATDRARIGVSASDQNLQFFTAGNNERLRINSAGQLHTTAGIAGANSDMANGYVASNGAVYTRGTVSSNARSNNGGYLSGFAIVNGDNSANGGGAAGGRIVANVSAICITSDGNAGDDSGGDLVFSTKPEAGNIAEQMRVFSGGGVTIPGGNLTLTTGNLVVGTSGKGIDFGAAAGQSGRTSSSNVLSDYEFGHWTPTLPSGGTLAINRATYVRVGNQVTIEFYISSIAPVNNSSVFQIYGLPFSTSSYTDSYGAIPISYWGDMNAPWMTSLITTHNSGTFLYLHRNDHTSATVSNSQFIATGTTNERNIIAGGTYITNN